MFAKSYLNDCKLSCVRIPLYDIEASTKSLKFLHVPIIDFSIFLQKSSFNLLIDWVVIYYPKYTISSYFFSTRSYFFSFNKSVVNISILSIIFSVWLYRLFLILIWNESFVLVIFLLLTNFSITFLGY